jgi:hypothetical protein
MMDACRNHAMAGSSACNPVLFEPMVMSIILDQAVKMRNMEERFYDLIWRDVCATIQPEENKKTLTSQKDKGDAYA